MNTLKRGLPAPLSPDERANWLPFVPSHSSGSLGWSGVRVEHLPRMPGSDIEQPPLAEHFLILQGSPESGRFECGDACADGSITGGSVAFIPAGASSRYRWEGDAESTHFQLNTAAVTRVAADAFSFDPTRLCFRPVMYSDSHPAIAATLAALRDELLTGGLGGRLCAESLANVLVVHLIRHLASGPPVRGLTGVLARPALKSVEEYVEDNLDRNIGLSDLAAVAHLSEYHFARLFKATTGQTPHQFVIGRRVERAKQLLLEGRLTLAEVAVACGFTDQSGFTKHFKRAVGVTPLRFLSGAGGRP